MNTPVVARLEPALRAVLVPLMREDGFRGSGRKFNKQSHSWLQLVSVQGSRYGGQFAINLAIHFAAAPDLLGNPPDPAKMTDAHCEFRRRLSQDGIDMWWRHENSAESILEAVKSASEMYAEFGRQYFSSAIATLEAITPEALSEGNYDLQGFHIGKPRLGLALARIRKLEGKLGDSRKFAEYALQQLQVTVAWSAELKALAA